ncbi:MAG: S1 family peptidase [Candidatus Binatia bacterium]
MVLLLYLTFIIVLFLLPAPASSRFSTSAEEFSASKNVAFTWTHARSRSLKILLEYRDADNTWRRLNLGSGFLLSPDGLFVSAYHVMKYCLEAQRETSGLSVKIDCSTARPNLRYIAQNGDREFEIEITSYLKETDSTNGKGNNTPDEIIKHRDFVIAKLKTDSADRFSYWRLQDFDQKRVDPSNPKADFSLSPLMPPKRVFIAGFPNDHDFVISEGFLNLTEEYNRGYFAADLKVYSTPYLKSLGVDANTQWGMRVDNHMSGGAVVDSSGYVVGLVVNGNHNTAGILSIENILATFFTRAGVSGARPAVVLNPTETPLFLKRESGQPKRGRESLRTRIDSFSRTR